MELGQAVRLNHPVKGLWSWIAHRLVANYWFLAVCAVIAAPLAFAASLTLDRQGLTAWLLDRGLAPVASADTAKEAAGVVAGIDAAFITLYFSISLIVLTIAAGNLGVRLIDRWLGRQLVRVSIAGLSFSLIFAVLTLVAIDAEAPLEETPLATFSISLLLLAVNVAMLAVALHDLGRTRDGCRSAEPSTRRVARRWMVMSRASISICWQIGLPPTRGRCASAWRRVSMS